MEELLNEHIGKQLDIVCVGGSSIRGEVVKVGSGVVQLKDGDETCFVAIDKITIVWEMGSEAHRAGFVSAKPT
jgi:NADPH:quinone reductase-like Zn-dependent oxidoreductase